MSTTAFLGVTGLALVVGLAVRAWSTAETGTEIARPAPVAAPAAVGIASPAAEPAARRQAVSALADLPAEPATQQDLHDWRAATQGASADAILELRHLALTVAHPAVVGACLAALGRLDAVATDAELLALLEDPRLRVRQDLVTALGHSHDPRALGLLVRVAEGPDPDLRLLAILALGRSGGEPATAALEALAARGTATPTEAAFLQSALRLSANPAADAACGPRGAVPASRPASESSGADPSKAPMRADESGAR